MNEPDHDLDIYVEQETPAFISFRAPSPQRNLTGSPRRQREQPSPSEDILVEDNYIPEKAVKLALRLPSYIRQSENPRESHHENCKRKQ